VDKKELFKMLNSKFQMLLICNMMEGCGVCGCDLRHMHRRSTAVAVEHVDLLENCSCFEAQEVVCFL
jgi:hypothetical protein